MNEHEKKVEIISKYLNTAETFVQIDARQPGVVVPLAHNGNDALVLKFSFKYSPGDLIVNEWGIRQTLSFGGTLFKVSVPWVAVYGAHCPALDSGIGFFKPAEPPAKTAPPRRGLWLVN